jgi:acyl-CoA thioesterase FadM
MNLYLRLLFLLIASRFKAGLTDILAASRLRFRVLPNDLDGNGHMNNGRYLTLMDLGRLDLVLRTGLLRVMMKRGCLPVLAAATIRYRLPLVPFRPFHLETNVVCWDEKWVYLEQRFIMKGGKKDGAVAAIALVKGSFWDKKTKRTVPTGELLGIIGLHRESPPMPQHFVLWQQSEDALRAVTAAEKQAGL